MFAVRRHERLYSALSFREPATTVLTESSLVPNTKELRVALPKSASTRLGHLLNEYEPILFELGKYTCLRTLHLEKAYFPTVSGDVVLKCSILEQL